MQFWKNQSRGVHYSAILHFTLLFFILVGLPNFLSHKPDPEPMSISVDILPIAPISNVRPQEKTPEKHEKKPVEEKKTEKKAVQEAKKEAASKEEPEPLPVSAKDVVKEKKKEEKKKTKDNDLDSILKSVKETAKSDESKKPTESKEKPAETKAISSQYDASQPLSMSEKDAIRSQFQKCWNVPAGAKDAHNLAVTLHVEVNQDGSVLKAELAQDQSRYNSDSFFRAAADSALRAVNRCSPLKNLSPEKFGSWHDMELTFDPKDMLF